MHAGDFSLKFLESLEGYVWVAKKEREEEEEDEEEEEEKEIEENTRGRK